MDNTQSSPTKPRQLVRRNAIHGFSNTIDEDKDDDDSLTNLNSRDRGEVSVKEAIGGLFSTKTTQQLTSHELVDKSHIQFFNPL